jgi:putative flippase GtrA
MSKWRTERRILSRYAVAGLLNAVVSLSAIYVSLASGLSPVVANVIGYAVGILISFTLSKTFVFESRQRTGPEMRRYTVAFIISFAANLAVLELVTRGSQVAPFVAQLAAISTYVLLMFALCRWVVFRAGVEERLAARSAKWR